MKLLHLLIILISFLTTTAQNLTVEDKEKVREIIGEITKKCNEIENMRCNYIHEKSVSLLEDEIEMSGTAIFVKPNNLYWSCNNDDNQYFILKNDSIKINNTNGVTMMPVQEHLIFREIHKIINNSISSNSFFDETNFTPTLVENENHYIINLKPKKNKMKSVMGNMTFHFDKSTLLLSQIEVTDSNNDITNIRLSDIYINQELDNNLFNF